MPTTTVFQCPVCGNALIQETTRYYCQNAHSFDIAREGYVNLLLPSHIGRGKPGDSVPMLQSRKAFLQQGYYTRFSDQVNAALMGALQAMPHQAETNILDAGCGEGYYTWRLRERLDPAVYLYGTDVAQPAIRYAAKRGHGIRFAVASSFHLPFLSESLAALLCIFAPRDEAEFHRVLRPQGTLIVAAPGPRHLFHLRTLMYEEPEPLGQKGTMTAGFELIDTVHVAYDIMLKSTEDLLNLVTMTPYSRHIDAETQERLKTITTFSTEVDFVIMTYRKV